MTAQTNRLPDAFRSDMTQRLGDHADAFFSALNQPPPTSVLMLRNKSIPPFVDDSTPVPWCNSGLFLDERPQFTLDPLFHAGTYYPMEASSMSIDHILRLLYSAVSDPTILDLCAAPGGKSAVIANYLSGSGFLVSNEVNKKRYRILKENCAKLGWNNIATSNLDPSRIAADATFDCVLADAPCSGEGLFRKDHRSIDQWSPQHVEHCALRQRRILDEAVRLLAPTGHLIYTTCTFNNRENIDNVERICREFNMKSLDPELGVYGAVKTEQGEAMGYQFYPHLTRGEGFFVAVLKKNNDHSPPPARQGSKSKQSKPTRQERMAIESLTTGFKPFLDFDTPCDYSVNWQGKLLVSMQKHRQIINRLMKGLPGLRYGLVAGEMKGTTPVPTHQLAISQLLNQNIRKVDLPKDLALQYLRKHPIKDQSFSRGWVLVTYQSTPLGWAKSDGRTLKNYYPTHLRILMD